MPSVRRRIASTVQSRLVRPGPDDTYADGDDDAWLRVDWPSLTRPIEVLGRRMNVIDTGGQDRPAILFVHGLGGIWQNWLLSIPPFMDTHRVVAMDLPGFGESEMPAEKISIQGYARTIDALCRTLGIGSAVVVGNSMGGFVSAELALSYASRVERLVLVSAAGLSIEHQRREPLLVAARIVAASARFFVARRDLIVHRPRLRRMALQGVVRHPGRLSVPLAWEMLAGQGKPGFIDALDALMSYSFRERLREIEVPVLIVWGRNDMFVPVADAARFERLIGPNARAVVLDDTGHVPMIERPSRFEELLRGAIAGESTAGPRVADVADVA